MELVTEPMTKEQWAKEHAPTYKQDPNLPDSLDMCMLCKAMCKKQNKPWPPCGNEKLNKAFQYYLLETEGQLGQLTTEEKFELRCRLDPAFWAAFEFEFDGKPWVARWYQEMSLRCVATNKADMIGRRAGKTETKIVECLHHCRYRIGAHGNDRAYAVHVFVPSENLLEHHWDEFEKFVQNSRTLKNMRIGGNKNDSIKFNNNTTIYVHILSMKSAIGTDAFFMWFDEAAFYDNDKALAHALGLAASHDNVPITMTSNSSGFQGKFYDYCNSSTTFMLQAPSYVNPEWNASKERFFRNNLTSEEYELLIKASWGESTSSVFKKDDIDYCLNAFPYSQAECSRSKPEGAFRCLGCDWNEAANGVHFVIVEFNERNAPEGRPLFKTVHKRAVRGEDWNHLAAQQVAWELLTGWGCDVAFLDFGGGGSLSVETVQRRCIESGRPALAQCIIPINMSEMITIPTPVSIGGAPTRKMQKNLMVNLSQILLERHQLAWPVEETFDSGQAIKSQAIIPQMRDYKVDRVSAKGYAVYGSASDIGDHTITAWMLAVYGCLVNRTDMLVGVVSPTATTWVPPPPLPSEKEKLKQKKPDAISKEIPGITQPQRAKGPGWGGSRPGRTNGLDNYRGRGW